METFEKCPISSEFKKGENFIPALREIH